METGDTFRHGLTVAKMRASPIVRRTHECEIVDGLVKVAKGAKTDTYTVEVPLEAGRLTGLRLETPGAGIDFARFPELEGFCGDWHADNINVRCCRELRHLRAWQFKPKSKNLADFAGATRLERLSLTQTSIASLDGLESLEDLRYLELAYALQLESLKALATAQ